jgi:maltooligosyltrehalose synthase
MTDVSIYVAIITAGAGVAGAAISQVATVIRDVRQSERERQERSATTTREACVALLRAAGELRTLAENIRSYRGDANKIRERVEDARSRAEATQVHAVDVGMQAPDGLAEPADEVASAASALADDVARCTDLNQGVVIGNPDVTKLVECIDAFRHAAVRYDRR